MVSVRRLYWMVKHSFSWPPRGSLYLKMKAACGVMTARRRMYDRILRWYVLPLTPDQLPRMTTLICEPCQLAGKCLTVPSFGSWKGGG